MKLHSQAILFLFLGVLWSHGQDSLSIKTVSEPCRILSDSLVIFPGTDSALTIPRVGRYQLPFYSDSSDPDSIHLPPSAESQQPDKQNLAAHGYITRGMQLGSSRGLSLQSGMHLRLSGSLGSGMEVSGVLTDQNSPLQPLGNTQTLSELDKVYIKLESENLSSQIGDIELGEMENGGLAGFQRKTNGLWITGRQGQWHSYMGGGFSYGTYHRQTFQGQDGKQGPYVLKGQNGEHFILILAGTEKVWLDGEIMSRGENLDYIIDYNGAEINFTNHHMISSQSRIVVEFEYAADAYLTDYSFGKQLLKMSVGYGDTTQKWSWRFSGNLIQDDARNPLGIVSADTLREVLGNLPDASGTIWVSTIRSDSAGAYLLSVDSILTYVGVGNGQYSAAFTFLGAGRGEYEKVQDATGAVYYQYAPSGGAYTPRRAYMAPQRHAMANSRIVYNGKFLKSWFDGAMSGFNPNTYAIQEQNDRQPGWRGGASIHIPIGEVTSVKIEVLNENLSENFRVYEPIYNEEYYRTWQIQPRTREQDQYQRMTLGFQKQKFVDMNISLDEFSRNAGEIGTRTNTQGYLGKSDKHQIRWQDDWIAFHKAQSWQRHSWEGQWHPGQWRLNGRIESESGWQDTTFFRNNNHVLNRVSLGYVFTGESGVDLVFQRRNELARDSVAAPDFLATKQQNWTESRDDYGIRLAHRGFQWMNGEISMAYRQQYHSRDNPSVSQGFILSNADLQGQLLESTLRYQTSFEMNEERIPQFEYYYIPVDTGYGNYSYDPVYGYIPTPGGRWLQQRSYTDREEQVRSLNSHSVIRFSHKMPKKMPTILSGMPFKLYTTLNVERKARTDTSWVLQDRFSSLSEIQVNPVTLWESVKYRVRYNRNDNNLHYYGGESYSLFSQELGMDWLVQERKFSTIFSSQSQVRTLTYNPIQNEDWQRYGFILELPWSVGHNQDLQSSVHFQQAQQAGITQKDQVWKISLAHQWHILRRGRLDQTAEFGSVRSQQNSLPYSLFDGRQPGENWEYRVNASYRFSNAFQLQSNFSVRKRGVRGLEQYFRMEGRAYF
ncbi:MAG: hypothetical protein K9N34_04450 [Candidatus Marinimicrobia bacterium]|nr:hypothetical protein [Candidatus Neomarinimicrobiota bacterium]MCF7839573.1 hypothetical protein [Candidatus Neomarinimicrobiota bacterium]MCF7903159.1 hypothetical protein [Candidatus Neomarinimicrobiota bacterium]